MSLSNKSIVIIGAGPGGYSAALEIRKRFPEDHIVLVEKNKLGGTCLHLGCITSKQLHTTQKLEDFPKLLAKNKMILEKAIESELKAANIEIIFAEATIEGSRVRLNSHGFSAELEYSHLIIATGSQPRTLKEFPQALTSDSFFSEENMAKGFAEKYCFIGGGYIGVELASMLARQGKSVRIIEVQDNILSFLDKDIHSKLMQTLKSQKIKVETGVEDLSTVALEPDEEVFVSVGREILMPSVIEPGAANVYVIGDASGEVSLAHYAYAQARQLAAKLAGEAYEIDRDKVPSVVFTHPEVASIGLTEAQAREKFTDNVESKIINWASNAKARIAGYDRGMTKWVMHDDKVVGCHIIGEHAADLISIVVPIMNMNPSVSEMHRWIYPHPTLGEIFTW